jgi:hypothetical protein
MNINKQDILRKFDNFEHNKNSKSISHQLSFNAACLTTLEEAQAFFAEALFDIYHYTEQNSYKAFKPYNCSLSDQELLYAFWREAVIISYGWDDRSEDSSLGFGFNVSLRLDLSQCSQKRYHQPFKADVKKEDWEKAMSKIAQDEINKEVIEKNLKLIKELADTENKLKKTLYQTNKNIAQKMLKENIKEIYRIRNGWNMDDEEIGQRPFLDFPRNAYLGKYRPTVTVNSFFDELSCTNNDTKQIKYILTSSGQEEIMDDFHPWLFFQYVLHLSNLSNTKVTYRGRQYQPRHQYYSNKKKKEVVQYEGLYNKYKTSRWNYPEMKIKHKKTTFYVHYKLEDLLMAPSSCFG